MIDYKVIKHIATLSETAGGVTKELNLISWNGSEAKFDIRSWKDTEQGRQMYKGVTLTADEIKALVKALKGEIEG